MGHGAWDMVSNEDLVAGFRIALALATPAPAQPNPLLWKAHNLLENLLSEDDEIQFLAAEWRKDLQELSDGCCVALKRGAAPAHPDPLHVANERGEEAKDAARYRRFFTAGLPITFLGVEYDDKASLDAAIDADLAQEGRP